MNWFVTVNIGGQSTDVKKRQAEQDSSCGHVQKDPSLAVANLKEMDTFGPVGTHVVCAECYDQHLAAKGEETHVCKDCGQVHKASAGIAWRWYDFYAAQGDVALRICNPCRLLPKHQERVRRDREDYEADNSYSFPRTLF